MKTNLPSQEDILFQEEKNSSHGAWLQNPTNKFFLYSEGYKDAGKRLYDFCIENSFYRNSLIYPIVFAYRQFLELRLKELIIMGYDYVDSKKDFTDIHYLKTLWKIYKYEILINIEQIEKETLDNVERVLFQFDEEDPLSMTFRYPVTKSREQSLKRNTIDLENFKEVIDRLIYFMDWQWEMISNYKIFKTELMSDMYSDWR